MGTELFHVQTNLVFDLPDNQPIVLIGKSSTQQTPDLDLAELPDADIISRKHAQIYQQDHSYFIEDLGSSNGTFLNQQRLLPHTCYDLNLGDQISLGQGNKVTLIFQQKLAEMSSEIPSVVPSTLLQSETSVLQPRPGHDRYSPANRFMGLGLMILSILLLAANTHIGLFVGMPAIVLCMAGLVMLMQTRYNPDWGWILIGIGLGAIVLQGRFFASANLLSVIVAVSLFLAGYQLFSKKNILKGIIHLFKP